MVGHDSKRQQTTQQHLKTYRIYNILYIQIIQQNIYHHDYQLRLGVLKNWK